MKVFSDYNDCGEELSDEIIHMDASNANANANANNLEDDFIGSSRLDKAELVWLERLLGNRELNVGQMLCFVKVFHEY